MARYFVFAHEDTPPHPPITRGANSAGGRSVLWRPWAGRCAGAEKELFAARYIDPPSFIRNYSATIRLGRRVITALYVRLSAPTALAKPMPRRLGCISPQRTADQSELRVCLIIQAYRASPADPRLMTARANMLHGAEHLAALERALAIFDPASREARRLRTHIAVDKAAGVHKLGRLASSYQCYNIELVPIGADPRRPRGVGLRVRLNDARNVRLMLDTGASGISISAKAAEKAGLEITC